MSKCEKTVTTAIIFIIAMWPHDVGSGRATELRIGVHADENLEAGEAPNQGFQGFNVMQVSTLMLMIG